MLELEQLTFSYGALRAVDGLDLTVSAGGVHGLIGPNGAGKSTCIDLISGAKTPKSGRIIFDGDDLTRRSVRWRRRAGISRSFQRISVFPGLTVREQLDLAARAVAAPSPDLLVDALDLGRCLQLPCKEISYGDQRRVDIALALIGLPRLVLLDEPTAGLARDESLRLAEHLLGLVREYETTVVLVEHDLEVVFRICDRLTVLEQGSVIAEGDPESVRRDPQVVDAYLGQQA